MSKAKFQVGEYVQLVNLDSGNSPQYEGTFAKVLFNRPAANPDNGYYYDVVVHDGRTKGLFERRLQELPIGTKVQITAETTFLGRVIPREDNIGIIEDVGTYLYGVRSIRTSKYYGVSPTEVLPVLTTQDSSTTQEETTMEAQVNTLTVGTKVRATQDVTGHSGRVLWLKGAVGTVRGLAERGEPKVQCTDDWFTVPKDQRQYWEVVPQDTPLTVCKPDPDPKPEPEPPKCEPETLVGKRVKIRKSSTYFDAQGRTTDGKRRKGIVEIVNNGGTWANVKFDDGYYNGYPITDLKIIKDKPKAPEFVSEPVTADTPVGTKVRVISADHRFTVVGAVGTLARHTSVNSPRVQFDNDWWYPHYSDLETVHPDTAITKDNGDAAL